MRSSIFSAAAVFALANMVTAQTFTKCDPLLKKCPDNKALGTSVDIDFTKGESKHFHELAGTSLSYGPDGMEFTIRNEKMAPTIESNWSFFFGTVDVVMKASPGQGIVSSFVLESDDLDEVDWEWLGGDQVQVQSNYFGKGDDSTFDRGGRHPVSNPMTEFHTYSLDWSAERLIWSINGVPVRTLTYDEAKGGSRYPQTPSRVKMGSWVAGSSTAPPGTVEWAGGLAQFGNKEEYTMYVKSMKITDAQTGATSYSYTDKTGSWQSIKVIKGDGSSEGGNGKEVEETSSSAKPTKSSSTADESSTKTTASSSATSASSTFVTTTASNSSDSAPEATDAPTTTGDSDATPTGTEESQSETPTGNSATKMGANLAMVGVAIAFLAL